jgi:UDP:flavonoid glycosyltransferase YjiC (YdhE family)
MPFSFDQPDNAERLRRLGVAEIADRFRVSNLASPLRRILGNSDAARRARALAAQIDPRSAVSEGVDWLEKLGADKSE